MRKILKNVLLKHIRIILLLFLIYVYSSIIGIIIPYLNSYFIDSLVQQATTEFVLKFFIFIFIIHVLGVALSYIYSLYKAKIMQKMNFHMHMKIMEYLERIPYELISKEVPSYLHNKVEQDVSQLTTFFVNNIYDVFINIIQLIVLLVIFFNVNQIIFISIILFIPCYIFVYILMKKPLYQLGHESAEATNKFYGNVNTEYERFRETRIYSDYSNRKNRMTDFFSVYIEAFLKYLKKTILFSSYDQLITFIFQIIILFIGGISIINGRMTIGMYTLINTYFSMVLSSIKYFFSFGKEYQVTKVSFDRLNELISIKTENNGNKIINQINNIRMDQFNYTINNRMILKEHLSFEISEPGMYAIIGQNGTGKTTLTNAIMGILNIGIVGGITLNQEEISSINMRYIRKNNISVMISSETFPEVTVEEYINAYLKIPNIEIYLTENSMIKPLFVSSLFNIKNHMTKKIQNLSSGEKQMLSLFSALAKERDLYIMDEPTSNIFIELKPILLRILQDLVDKGKSVIIISHDNEIIKACKKSIKL